MPAKKTRKKKVKSVPAASKSAPEAESSASVPLKQVPFWIGFDLGGTKMLATVLGNGVRLQLADSLSVITGSYHGVPPKSVSVPAALLDRRLPV